MCARKTQKEKVYLRRREPPRAEKGGENMAEREGFEPSVLVSLYGGLANRWIKPLSHLSGDVREPHNTQPRRKIPIEN